MALPAIVAPASLDFTRPLGTETLSEGDDWIRYLLQVLQNYFKNVAGVVNSSHSEMNFLVGVTSLIQAQLDSKATIAALGSITATGAVPLVISTGTAVTASEGVHYALQNVAATTVTLPPTPTVGATIWVTPVNALATNLIARNGNNIMSLAEDMTLDATNFTTELRYINATVGWRLV